MVIQMIIKDKILHFYQTKKKKRKKNAHKQTKHKTIQKVTYCPEVLIRIRCFEYNASSYDFAASDTHSLNENV